MKVAVVDYGSGNLRSVQKALERAGDYENEVVITSDPEFVRLAERVVFPGQGAMPDCMRNLRDSGLYEALLEAIRNKPFFAVCIGEQMLFEHSEEGDVDGLGFFKGTVVRFPDNMTDCQGNRLKVPQMGWNQVSQTLTHPLWEGIPDQSWFYFVHSYYASPTDRSIVTGTTNYGLDVTVAVARDNVFATQFHPEKSAAMGLKLYRNFLNWRP